MKDLSIYNLEQEVNQLKYEAQNFRNEIRDLWREVQALKTGKKPNMDYER